jgi:hypothetical protein
MPLLGRSRVRRHANARPTRVHGNEQLQEMINQQKLDVLDLNGIISDSLIPKIGQSASQNGIASVWSVCKSSIKAKIFALSSERHFPKARRCLITIKFPANFNLY